MPPLSFDTRLLIVLFGAAELGRQNVIKIGPRLRHKQDSTNRHLDWPDIDESLLHKRSHEVHFKSHRRPARCFQLSTFSYFPIKTEFPPWL